MKIFARLMKVEENTDGSITIIGRATQEVPDKTNEIFDYEKSVPHFKAWSDEISKATDGKSVGNLRAMHSSIAAGKLTEINYLDAEKAIDIKAQVIDSNEVKKTLAGVYSGFSIGGKYMSKWADSVNPKMTRFEAKPAEISLVDSPCLGVSTFSIQKMDGSTVEQEFKPVEKSVVIPAGAFAINNEDDLNKAITAYMGKKSTVAEKRYIIKQAKALGKESLIPEAWTRKAVVVADLFKSVGSFENKEAALEVLKKYSSEEIYDVSTAVQCLMSIAYLYEKESGEAEPDAEQITFLQTAIDNIKQFIASEIMEADEDDVITRANLAVFLKGEGKPEEQTAFTKILEEAGVALLKRGARNSKGDMDMIQSIHDNVVSLGAICGSGDKANPAEDLQKNLTKITVLEADKDFLLKCFDAVSASLLEKSTAYDDLKKKWDESPAAAKGTAAGAHLAPIITKQDESLGKISAERKLEIEGLEKRIKEARTPKQREDMAQEVIKMIFSGQIKK